MRKYIPITYFVAGIAVGGAGAYIGLDRFYVRPLINETQSQLKSYSTNTDNALDVARTATTAVEESLTAARASQTRAKDLEAVAKRAKDSTERANIQMDELQTLVNDSIS